MKRVLIVCHFAGGRFRWLADAFRANGLEVRLLTSSFSHKGKSQKQPSSEDYIDYFYEPGYPINVCPQRLLSHHIAGRNLDKLLSRANSYDLVYCAVPSLTVGGVMRKWAREWGAPFVIDVQDLWPEQFRMALGPGPAGDILFKPLERKANSVYAAADMIVAVSDTYVRRAKKVNKKAEGIGLYLGTELCDFDKNASHEKPSTYDGSIRVAYIGTLGTSYDLKTVIEAISLAEREIGCGLELLVMGDGPHRKRFEEFAARLGINAHFTGRLPYDEMTRRLTECDIAVNPFIKTAPHSIVNKVGDYAAAALPVVNTLPSSEYREVLADYNAGISCQPEDPYEVSQAIALLATNSTLRKEIGENNRHLAEDRFDRNKTYPELVSKVLALL